MRELSPSYGAARRRAYVMAALAILLLAGGTLFGFMVETNGFPRAASSRDGGLLVLYRASTPDVENPIHCYLMALDSSLRPGERHRLLGDARAFLAREEEQTFFFGRRYVVQRGGATLRGGELEQKWDVVAAAQSPESGPSWIFGWSERRIVARRSVDGTFGEEIAVAEASEPDRISASMDGPSGPLVTWRERGSTRARSFLFDGRAFVPRAEFEIGAAEFWDAVLMGPRALLVYHLVTDRRLAHVILRVACCTACGLPAPPVNAILDKPMLLIGHTPTGLAMAVAGDRLLAIVSSPTHISTASLPLSAPQTDRPARLSALTIDPLHRRILSSLWPQITLFCAASLVFLGIQLLRERARLLFATIKRIPIPDPESSAGLLQRGMAFFLDFMACAPLFTVAAEFIDLIPNDGGMEAPDHRFLLFAGSWLAIRFFYHLIQEAATGRTIGKMILGIRVAGKDGARLSFRGALIRNLVRLIEAELHPGLLLGVACLLLTGRKRRRLGDILARSCVLREDSPHEGIKQLTGPA